MTEPGSYVGKSMAASPLRLHAIAAVLGVAGVLVVFAATKEPSLRAALSAAAVLVAAALATALVALVPSLRTLRARRHLRNRRDVVRGVIRSDGDAGWVARVLIDGKPVCTSQLHAFTLETETAPLPVAAGPWPILDLFPDHVREGVARIGDGDEILLWGSVERTVEPGEGLRAATIERAELVPEHGGVIVLRRRAHAKIKGASRRFIWATPLAIGLLAMVAALPETRRGFPHVTQKSRALPGKGEACSLRLFPSCDPGLLCVSDVTHDGNGDSWHCQPTCTRSSECAEGEFCSGICLPIVK